MDQNLSNIVNKSVVMYKENNMLYDVWYLYLSLSDQKTNYKVSVYADDMFTQFFQE